MQRLRALLASLAVVLASPASAVACPMLSTGPAMSGCAHCPPAPAHALRAAVPECCTLHAAPRPTSEPAECAGVRVATGPALLPTVQPLALPIVVEASPAPVLERAGAGPPRARNLPLLR